MQIPGLGEMGTSGMVGALGTNWSMLAIFWKISLSILLISIAMALLRFLPRAEV